MVDESRRDDISWLVATYDGLVSQTEGTTRDADLEQVQRWLCRVTGLSSLSAAVAAARRLTRHEISFITPVRLAFTDMRLEDAATPQDSAPQPRNNISKPARSRVPTARREEPARDLSTQEDRRRRSDDCPAGTPAPPLTDRVAARLEQLFDELDRLPGRRTTAQKARAERLRRLICEVSGHSRIETARTALRAFLTRRDGVRRFVPTKSYAEGPARKPPPITVVRGGSPGGGRRS